MDILNLEGYKSICISYATCFGWLFPELKYFCAKDEFHVHGGIYKYTDITGTDYSQNHFIIEIAHERCLYLPIAEKAKFHLVEKNTKMGFLN